MAPKSVLGAVLGASVGFGGVVGPSWRQDGHKSQKISKIQLVVCLVGGQLGSQNPAKIEAKATKIRSWRLNTAHEAGKFDFGSQEVTEKSILEAILVPQGAPKCSKDGLDLPNLFPNRAQDCPKSIFGAIFTSFWINLGIFGRVWLKRPQDSLEIV